MLNYKVSNAQKGVTYVEGSISTDTVWTLTDSPYVLSNDLIINSGVASFAASRLPGPGRSAGARRRCETVCAAVAGALFECSLAGRWR